MSNSLVHKSLELLGYEKDLQKGRFVKAARVCIYKSMCTSIYIKSTTYRTEEEEET